MKACSLSSWLHCCGNVGKDPSTAVLCQTISKISGNADRTCKLPAGQDIAGIVSAVGEDVTTLAKGDYVVGKNRLNSLLGFHFLSMILKPL